VSGLSRKTAAWASGAVIAVGACTAGIVLATTGGGSPAGHTAAGSPAHAAAARKPLRLVSVSPADGAENVNGAGTVTVTYNQPLPATAPLPVLAPAVAGAWQRTGDTAVFTPVLGYPEHTRVTITVTIPGSGIGTSAAAGGTVAGGAAVKAPAKSATASPHAAPAASSGSQSARDSVSDTFVTGAYSTLRMQQILAQLGYLPMTWTQSAGAAVTAGSAASQLAAAYAPPAGTFTMAPGYPSQLQSFWTEGEPDTMTRGAIMGFEADHNLTVDGTASAGVWTALLTAAEENQQNTHGYSYAIASKSLPERLTIWHNGKKVFSSLANTGIGVAPTVNGTFPVYEKLPFQIMSGTNPDGSHYADPVQWVSYFNGGDAVHYFARYSYGWPQSLGCVELPYSTAEAAYSVLPYGTLVTVT
jgi:peptidoglycan hydrolase-like protein with peptidoglycan-binding domain